MPVQLPDGRNWIVCITDLWSKAVWEKQQPSGFIRFNRSFINKTLLFKKEKKKSTKCGQASTLWTHSIYFLQLNLFNWIEGWHLVYTLSTTQSTIIDARAVVCVCVCAWDV